MTGGLEPFQSKPNIRPRKFNFHCPTKVENWRVKIDSIRQIDRLARCELPLLFDQFSNQFETNKKFKNTKHSEFLIFTRDTLRSCQTKPRDRSEISWESENVFHSLALLHDSMRRLFVDFFRRFSLCLHFPSSHVVTFHFHGEKKQQRVRSRVEEGSVEWNWRKI